MGFALAEAAIASNWEVSLVAGPVTLSTPPGIAERVDVETGEEMYQAIADRFPACHILIMTAAVMDYRPRERSLQKVKKERLSMTVEMEPARDILKTVAAQKSRQCVVGFAAETEKVEKYGLDKLHRKNCDFLVANRVGQPGTGFASDDNTVVLLHPSGQMETFGPASKKQIAIDLIARFKPCLQKRFA